MKMQHYLGGVEGLGPVTFEKRVFVEPWEKRIFGIHVAMMALSSQLPLPPTPSRFNTVWTWADLRKGAKSLNPMDYFKYRYYEKWLGGISGYFVEKGYITEAELEARTAADPAAPRPPRASRAAMPAIDRRIVTYLVEGDSPKRDTAAKPALCRRRQSVRQEPADASSIRACPAICATAPASSIRSIRATYSYLTSTGPDGIGRPMPVYCVRFDPEDIWKGNTEKNVTIYADLFEAYLDKPN